MQTTLRLVALVAGLGSALLSTGGAQAQLLDANTGKTVTHPPGKDTVSIIDIADPVKPKIEHRPPPLVIGHDFDGLGSSLYPFAASVVWWPRYHPHVHMIVPGGGISLDGTRWVRCKPGFLLPVRVLSRLFRRLFLAALAHAHAAGRLAFFGEIASLRRREALATHLAPLRRKNWFVYTKPPFAGPEAVLAYLARYTHRVAIANSRRCARRARRDLPVQELSPQRAGAVSHNDARRR
jgi:Putative transposase